MIVDMHTHSLHSHDSVCTVQDMAQSQKQQGTSLFAVTDHCDVEFCKTQDLLQIISASVFDAQTQNGKVGGIDILRGVEIGEGHWHPNESRRMVSALPYDVIIGSVHAVKFEELTMPYSGIDFAALGREQTERYLDTYFDDLLEMIQTTEFDILAHLTCPLRYINGRYAMGIDCRRYEKKIAAVLGCILEKGIALEINTSCKGGAYDAFLPEEWIVALYRSLGGVLVTLGSDAHIAENASHAFDEAVEMLKRNGFAYAYYYKNRRALSYAL